MSYMTKIFLNNLGNLDHDQLQHELKTPTILQNYGEIKKRNCTHLIHW